MTSTLRCYRIAARYFNAALHAAQTASETAHYYRAMLYCANALREMSR